MTNDLNQIIVEIGNKVKAHRAKHSLTQEKLAELADLHEKHLSAVENGRLDNVSIGYLVDIANALEINYKDLL